MKFRTLAGCLFTALVFAIACSSSNNLLLGRVESNVGGHTIAVTDCYRTSVPPPQATVDAASGKSVYSFSPCRDAVITIRDEDLTVNGRAYGKLNPNDRVTVDHGKVLVNDQAATAIAAKEVFSRAVRHLPESQPGEQNQRNDGQQKSRH